MTKFDIRNVPDVFEVMLRDVYNNEPKMRAVFDQEALRASIAAQIHRMRRIAGITQAVLAKRVGTSTSVISRLESAEYKGHSLKLLHRVADALDYQVEVTFRPKTTPRARKPRRPAA